MKKAPELLTTAELAQVLRCNPRTVQRMLEAGEIPAVVNRPSLKRFRLEDVLEALGQPETAAKGPQTVSDVYETHGRRARR